MFCIHMYTEVLTLCCAAPMSLSLLRAVSLRRSSSTLGAHKTRQIVATPLLHCQQSPVGSRKSIPYIVHYSIKFIVVPSKPQVSKNGHSPLANTNEKCGSLWIQSITRAPPPPFFPILFFLFSPLHSQSTTRPTRPGPCNCPSAVCLTSARPAVQGHYQALRARYRSHSTAASDAAHRFCWPHQPTQEF